MSNEEAVLSCTFGWGKICRLYDDSIEIGDKTYNLKDLTFIQPSYRTIFGISSARLVLSFGLDRLVLRGIADLNTAHLMVSHLQPYCSTAPHAAHKRSRTKGARSLARAQAKAWERTNKLPAILDIPEFDASPDTPQRARMTTGELVFDEAPPTGELISLDAVPKAPVEDTSLTPGETLEAFAQLANNLSTYASPLPTALWQPPHTPRFQPPLHSVHLIPPDQKFDSNSIPVPVVKSSVLPIIHVPVRLQHGECAHYSIGATLCSDRISNATRATYPLLDQGLLVLTNRRVLYIGKRCQFTLAYTHLWYVSLLHTAIALHIEGQFRRIIIELEHPHEWASRIELLSFIARRSRPHPEPPTLSVPVIPGQNMTLKRKAIKAPRNPALADNAAVLLPGGRIVESRIVEAETIEFQDETLQACAKRDTIDMPNSPESAASVENSASSIAEKPTRDFPAPADIAHVPTREFSPEKSQPDAQDEPLAPEPSQADIAGMVTREFSLSSQKDKQRIDTPARPDITHMATQEFSLSEQEDEDNTQKHTAGLARSEKTTPGLHIDQEELARLQASRPPDKQPEIMTGALYNPALPLTALVSNEHKPAGSNEPSEQNQEDDDDDRTIHLRERKLSVLRTISLYEPVSDQLPDIEPAKQRPARVRTSQRPL
jgi:hypothetical protein